MAKQIPLKDTSDQPTGRVPQLLVATLAPAQKKVLDFLLQSLSAVMVRSIIADDGYIAGAFNYLLIDPAVGLAFSELGAALGEKSERIDSRLRELIILETAQQIGCGLEWNAHAPAVASVGISSEEVLAIAEEAPLPTPRKNEELVREIVRTLVLDRKLPDALFEEALIELGLVLLFDVVMLIGYYQMMSMPLAAFGTPSR